MAKVRMWTIAAVLIFLFGQCPAIVESSDPHFEECRPYYNPKVIKADATRRELSFTTTSQREFYCHWRIEADCGHMNIFINNLHVGLPCTQKFLKIFGGLNPYNPVPNVGLHYCQTNTRRWFYRGPRTYVTAVTVIFRATRANDSFRISYREVPRLRTNAPEEDQIKSPVEVGIKRFSEFQCMSNSM